jgi:hypothetical protein
LGVDGRFQHIVAHEAEGCAQIQAGLRQMVDQRQGKRAVGRVARATGKK